MSKRTNHPLKTLFLLAVVGAVAWGAYEFLYVRGVLRGETTTIDVDKTRQEVRTLILDAYRDDPCLEEVEGISYRANEQHFRIQITVNYECRDQAREMCRNIVSLAADAAEQSISVFAYNGAGTLMARSLE